MDKMYQTIRAEMVLILILMAAKDYWNTNGYNTDWFKMNKEQQFKKNNFILQILSRKKKKYKYKKKTKSNYNIGFFSPGN